MPELLSDKLQFFIFHFSFPKRRYYFFRLLLRASAAIPAAPKTAMPIQRPMGEESPVLGKFQAFFGPYSGVTVGCHGDGVSVGTVGCVGDGVAVGSVLCVGDGVSVGSAVDALSVKGISITLSSLKYAYSVCCPGARVSRQAGISEIFTLPFSFV